MRLILPIFSSAALIAAAFFLGVAPSTSAQESVTVTLGPGRDASQTGTATLTAQGNQTQVVINIQSGPAGVGQPAHIHEGDCPGVGAVAFPLTTIVDGASTTAVTASLSDLLAGNYAINIHQDETQAGLGVYVSCGAVAGQPTASAAPTGGATATATPASIPQTGGAPGSDSSFPVWLLGAVLGAVSLAVAGVAALRGRRIS